MTLQSQKDKTRLDKQKSAMTKLLQQIVVMESDRGDFNTVLKMLDFQNMRQL
jgi:hypothetical protein